jgi:hypothetical protein
VIDPMQKQKPSTPKKKNARTPAVSKAHIPIPKTRGSVTQASEEYAEYLERYEMYGEDRPRLSPTEFNRLDDELLDLLAEAEEGALSDEQAVRLRELEFLLLDEQSDSSF